MKTSDFKRLEKVKASYLKKVLGVGTNSKSRLVYELTREIIILEDICLTYLLPSTGPYDEELEERKMKRKGNHEDFYTTTAIQERSWIKENQPQRYIINLATHGFHHEPCESCICEWSENQCDRNNILKCLNISTECL
mgnify:CR=1 FL=1